MKSAMTGVGRRGWRDGKAVKKSANLLNGPAGNRETSVPCFVLCFWCCVALFTRIVNTQRLSLYMLGANSFQYCFVFLCIALCIFVGNETNA